MWPETARRRWASMRRAWIWRSAVRFDSALSLLAIGHVDRATEHLMGGLEDYSNCEYEPSARRVLAEPRWGGANRLQERSTSVSNT
jgi:hypothetical protein